MIGAVRSREADVASRLKIIAAGGVQAGIEAVEAIQSADYLLAVGDRLAGIARLNKVGFAWWWYATLVRSVSFE